MFGAAWGAQVGVMYWFHSPMSDLAGRRTSSSSSPHPQRQLLSYKGKKLGMERVWAHSEKQSGLRQLWGKLQKKLTKNWNVGGFLATASLRNDLLLRVGQGFSFLWCLWTISSSCDEKVSSEVSE